MDLLILRASGGHRHSVHLGAPLLLGLVAFLAALAALAGWAGYRLAVADLDRRDLQLRSEWAADVAAEQRSLEKLRAEADAHLLGLTRRLAELQARAIRLDALGEHLTQVADLDDGEFDFDQAPAVGGPEDQTAEPVAGPALAMQLDALTARFNDRALQLNVLEALIAGRDMRGDVYLAGRPVERGWMSSAFGYRTDPFHGRKAWHNGVDFAGREGDRVVAVAAGVVTWSGERSGYGNLVEVNHGSGYTTRYAHNEENLVQAGDVVAKGQALATMGSSGRSTGPHVHFEVLVNGKAVDPERYVWRTDH